MDPHEPEEFLWRANISITQNNNAVQLPTNPFESDITAYVDGRFEEVQAYEAGKMAGPAMESESY